MFQKEELIQKLKEYPLNPEEFYLIAGGSLVMHGVKEQTEDIDLTVSSEQFQILKEVCGATKTTKPYPNLYNIGQDGILEVVLDANFSLTGKEKIDGIWCTSFLEEYQWKKEKNREKDQEILKKMEQILKQNEEEMQ